jgi:hypothetical protein
MLVYTITKGNNKSFVYDIYHGIQGEKGDQGIQGEQGIQGVPGIAATIQVGNVTSGAAPSVTNVGTSNAAIFDFVLEKGDKGEQGDKGQAAGFGTPTASATALPVGSDPTVSVTASGDPTQKVFAFSFGIPSGGDDNVQADWDQTDTTADDYIKNKPTIPVVATAIAAGDTGYTTGDQVYTAFQNFETDVWEFANVRWNSDQSKIEFQIYKNGALYTEALNNVCSFGIYLYSVQGYFISGSTTNINLYNNVYSVAFSSMPNINNNKAYAYRMGTVSLTEVSSGKVFCISSFYRDMPATSVTAGTYGFTTGDQVYNYVDTQIGNINTILQSI